MILRVSVLFIFFHGCEANYAISLEVALLRMNGSVDNVLPFELGGQFAILGKHLKLKFDEKRWPEYFEVELLRLAVQLDKMRKVILNNNKEVKKKLMEFELLENVKRPLFKNWEQMLNLLKDPTMQEWNEFEYSCPQNDSNFLMKKIKLNVDRSKHIMVEQLRTGSIGNTMVQDLRMAIKKMMLLTIPLVHLCGGAKHGGNFDEISDDSVLYMRALHHNILDSFDIDKLTVQAEQRYTTITPGDPKTTEGHESSKFDRRQPSLFTSSMKEFTRLSKMVVVTTILTAVKAGENLPPPLGTMMEVLGKGLSSFDFISDLNYFDDNREVTQQLRSVKTHLEHLSKDLADIDKQITSGHRDLIHKINDASITQDVLAPMNVMREYLDTFVRSPCNYTRNRLHEQCRNDLPRQWMSKLMTHTRREMIDQRKLIRKENFRDTSIEEIDVHIWYRVNMMYNITMLHSFCHAMLVGTKDAPEVDVEVEFVEEMFNATRNELFAVFQWRVENYFKDPEGVEGLIRNAAKKVPSDQPHSVLSKKVRDELQEHFPRHEWIVLVYSGLSSSEIEHPRFPDLKCNEDASLIVRVNEKRSVFVVRTKKQRYCKKNGRYGGLKNNMKFGDRIMCSVASRIMNLKCEKFLEPVIDCFQYDCRIVVEEGTPVGISATPCTYGKRAGGGISVCLFGCEKTFTLTVKDPQTENYS